MTLRTRSLIASGVALLLVVLLGLLAAAQFVRTASSAIAVQPGLTTTVNDAAQLGREQAAASASLTEYVLLGRPTSLDGYRQAVGRATTLLDQLKADTSDDTALTDLVTAARTAQRGWVKADAEPTITLMESNRRARAAKETTTDASAAAYDAMTTASAAIIDAATTQRDAASASVASYTRTLGVLMFVGALVIALLAIAMVAGLQAWVLAPLNALRENLQRSAREPHATPITPVGPPEIAATAAEAEELRQGLLGEVAEAQAAREGLVQDAPLVAAMQAELEGRPLVDVPGLSVAGTTQSTDGIVPGDWWDAVRRPDGSVAIAVADVSGHGPQASITAVRARSILRAALAEGLAPERAVSMVSASCSGSDHVITGIVLIADPAAGELTWCNAGHQPAIVVTRDKEASLCEPTGPVMSALGGEWESRTRPLALGDALVAYTDGLVESRNADGDELESGAVAQFIRGMDAPVRESPQELVTQLLAQVRHRAADWRRDDVTVVAAARRG